MGLRDRIVVPGIKKTNFGKKREIDRCVNEYSGLLEERKTIDSQIDKIEEFLGLKAKSCKNLDEYCKEADRLTALQAELKDIHTKGKNDPTQLNESQLLIFQRLEEFGNLNEKNYLLTIKILAIRQGLMNVADPENSRLSKDLSDKYISPAEFIKHSSLTRLVDFLNACKRTGTVELPDFTAENITDLVVSDGKSPQATELTKASPMLKAFVKKLQEVNERTGYSTDNSPVVPFAFAEGRLAGEIIINTLNREIKDRTKND